MHPVVNKIVTWCLSPHGLLYLGLAAAGLLAWMGRDAGRSRLRFLGRGLAGFVLVAFWILGCGVTTRLIGVPLEGEEVSTVNHNPRPQPLPDAIVLLGGGMGVHRECGRPEIYAGADRVWTAAKLWREMGGVLTVSGGGARGEIAFLIDMGVDTNRIVMIEEARNTEEEARLIKGKISNLQPSTPNAQPASPRIALVTSAWHMPRAKMLFERAGFDVTPVPTDFEMHCAAEEPLKIGEFFPSPESLVRNAYAIKEWIARALYWIKYG